MDYIYSFRGDCEDKAALGNKGANLVIMTRLGLPVPPGFVVSVQGYNEYKKTGRLAEKEIAQALAELEKQAHAKLGKGLQVSVRSSAPISMPGMMDTVLNINSVAEMRSAIKRIFDSWDNMRAVEYRRLNHIASDIGTAAVVQAMVFGNKDSRSGTGVVFSRDPSTGESGLFGECIECAQGEDIVSGSKTPVPISQLKSSMPEVYKELEQKVSFLEKHFRNMQDIEFTVESGKLYILQTRSAKRSGQAAVRSAVDMVHQGLITQEEAILRLNIDDLRALLHKHVKSTQSHEPLTKGLAAAPGAVSGQVVFTVDDAMTQAKKSIPSILVRPETSPDDIQGIAAADGVLTSRGGLTSHAAIVTRAMGKPCVCGAEDILIDLAKKLFTCKGQTIYEGDTITIDGTSGMVYLGVLPMEEGTMIKEFEELLTWLDGAKRLGVRANADIPEMVAQAIKLGAEGIGLCRTERQFSGPERLSAIREYILAATPAQKSAALKHLSKLQKEDFIALFKELKGLPIIIRLLDLPLHEFLPSEKEATDEKTRLRIAELKEINPMLGHRGVRVAVTNPEIYLMQVQAIEAAKKEVPADVSIMIPQVITSQELIMIKKSCTEGSTLKVGTMMETVRACMRAGRLAEVADFLSFGTNDLTQAVYSFSREDAEKKFLSTYLEIGILENNPFEIIDIKGVGRLMETAIFWARRAKQDIPIGVCGEQAGEPHSISFFHAINVDYVSCSPFRVPIAKLIAAQAAIKQKNQAEVIV
ncbi:MAG: pyruvate, phosphate dikinase [Dehalococcoidia bacterium]|jgi:pyruvate,orthophosphate dikinase